MSSIRFVMWWPRPFKAFEIAGSVSARSSMVTRSECVGGSSEDICSTQKQFAICHIKSAKSSRSLLFKLERAVFRVDVNGLAFADFAFEDVDRQRIENLFLNRAPERTRAVNRIVTFAGKELFSRIRQVERDLLLLEPFRQSGQLDFNDLLQIILAQPIEDDDLVDAVKKFGTEMRAQRVHDQSRAGFA